MIRIYYKDIKKLDIKQTAIKQWLKKIALTEGYKVGELTYIFCSDEYLLCINQQYLNHNTYTDVITFDNNKHYPTPKIIAKQLSSKKEKAKIISGDIFISLERVTENAKKFKVSSENELFRVMIHGMLHLMGYNDKSPKDKKMMRAKEEKSLTSCPSF